MFGMHWLGWIIIGILAFIAWMGRPMDFPVKRKTLAPQAEELERRE